MPATLLMTGENANRYFAVSRFDRSASGSNHVHTLSGLVEADHRIPSVNYDTLLKVTRLLTRDERHVLQMFRRMVFNVSLAIVGYVALKRALFLRQVTLKAAFTRHL